MLLLAPSAVVPGEHRPLSVDANVKTGASEVPSGSELMPRSAARAAAAPGDQPGATADQGARHDSEARITEAGHGQARLIQQLLGRLGSPGPYY
jgi:hypothetical protein